MKNIYRKTFLSLFVIGLFTTSCSDALDITQKGTATEEVIYKTLADLQTGLNAAYLQYNPGANSNGDGDAILFNDLFTDNLKTGSSYSGHGIGTYQWNIQASSFTPTSIWSNRYATINLVNRVLRAADRIEPTLQSSELSDFNHLKGQLYALRAIAHYDIFMYFTPNYQDSSSLSAIIVDYVPEITDTPARNTAGEVVDFIFADLDRADAHLSDEIGSAYFINKDVVKAFRAKLSLAVGDYSTAGTLASELLAAYPLANRDQYIDLFKDLNTENQKIELIFGLLRVRGNSAVAGSWYSNSSDVGGSPLFEMSQQLYNLFEPGDVRIDEVLLDDTSDEANGLLLIDKYPGGEQPLLNHLKIVRSSEMAFILAEVQARDGLFVEAANTLRLVTDARYNGAGSSPSISFGNLNDALNRILIERRKEFCFEGHRYLDLKRIGKEIGVGIHRLESDANSFAIGAPTDLPPTDYRFTLPIPQSEINGNRSVEQNPEYTNN